MFRLPPFVQKSFFIPNRRTLHNDMFVIYFCLLLKGGSQSFDGSSLQKIRKKR